MNVDSYARCIFLKENTIHTAQKIKAILYCKCNIAKVLQKYKLTICLQNVSNNMLVIFHKYYRITKL